MLKYTQIICGKILLLVFTITFALSGCNEEKGKDFIGKWYQDKSQEFPSTLNIKYEEGIYHIDFNYLDENLAKRKYSHLVSDFFDGKSKIMPSRKRDYGKDSYRVKALEAKAISNTVLQGNDFSLRLENGKLKFNEEVYEKK
ncbi:hypothetical protein [Arsenophonus endosymbiont of Apis mellifera]|jgi:hypothetical protein|uniref:hypothetical protein n=1 Tax=Arsenophonus endosymbiont of Apis mellifera TaxID=1541805 RepID=UPI0015D800B7|nr:hypothetical protein [Arsenophonus endosymbiont of Apis mellifera]